MVARHDTTDQIAFALGISTSTVEKHIAEAMLKLGVSSRRSAAKLMIEHDDAAGYKPTTDIFPIDSLPFDAPALPSEPDGCSRLRDVASERAPDPLSTWIPTGTPKRGWNAHDLTALQRLVLIAAITVLIAVILIAIPPMAESYRSLANQIEPFHRN